MKNIRQFKFKSGVDIGSLSAEDDRFLINAFISKEEYLRIRDIEDQKCIILGRTGSGKSAILKYIELREQNVIRINPENLSLQFLSNSNILNYLRSLDAKLDLFYKLLWKHVIIIEILKMHFPGDGKGVLYKLQQWIDTLGNRKEYKRALDYLKNFEQEFWQKSEERIKDIEKKIENEFSKSLKIPLTDLSLSIANKKNISETERIEIIHKADSIIKDSQLSEINEVINALGKEILPKSQKKYYILIDDLDKDWVDEKIVNPLIKSLISTIYDLRNLHNVKIIVALRTNIIELAFYDDNSRDIQREKYSSLVQEIRWTKDELRDLVNKRLSELFKGEYTNDSPTVTEIFPERKKLKKNAFDEILDKSFLRPRDIIDFVNKAIQFSQGGHKITRDSLNKAEYSYSKGRFKALIDEWKENYSNISTLVSLLNSKPEPINLRDFSAKDLNEFFIKAESGEFRKMITGWYKAYKEDDDLEKLLRNIFCLLYKIGFVGIKLTPEQEVFYSYNTDVEILPNELNINSKFYIHPAFQAYLKTPKNISFIRSE